MAQFTKRRRTIVISAAAVMLAAFAVLGVSRHPAPRPAAPPSNAPAAPAG